jgi:hypothetical protein
VASAMLRPDRNRQHEQERRNGRQTPHTGLPLSYCTSVVKNAGSWNSCEHFAYPSARVESNLD